MEESNNPKRSQGLVSIEEILNRRRKHTLGPSSEETSQMREEKNLPPRIQTRTEECTCETCGKEFQGDVTTYRFLSAPRESRARECPECKEKREAEEEREIEQQRRGAILAVRERWHLSCGLAKGLNASTFENLDASYQPTARKLCRKWAREFDPDNPTASTSLLLYSPGPGVGKTTLMHCIANYIIDKWEGAPETARCPLIFVSGPGLGRRIRATFNIPSGDTSHEQEEHVYNELRGISLLMLDDVGKEQPKSLRFTQEMYWYIIDERLKSGLPVVLNSRLPLEGRNSLADLMGVDTVDRLFGMTRGRIIELRGESYRRIKKLP